MIAKTEQDATRGCERCRVCLAHADRVAELDAERAMKRASENAAAEARTTTYNTARRAYYNARVETEASLAAVDAARSTYSEETRKFSECKNRDSFVETSYYEARAAYEEALAVIPQLAMTLAESAATWRDVRIKLIKLDIATYYLDDDAYYERGTPKSKT